MATLDGDTVNLNDKVYDLLYGEGEVQEILAEGRFRVKFLGKPQLMAYASTGIGLRYSRRTLYWHNPVLVNPFKSEEKWETIRPVLVDLVNSLRINRGA